MIAYKLLRQLKNGELTPLFINKTQRIQIGEWMEAENHPTKGFKVRPFWHCTSEMNAPHLSKKGRVWCKVDIMEYTLFDRPQNQGGQWYLAKYMKILEVIG